MGCGCNTKESVREKENIPNNQAQEQNPKVINVQKSNEPPAQQNQKPIQTDVKEDISKKNNSQLNSFTKENLNLERMRELELEEHNRLRRLHGAPPLILNDDLNEMAQKYAQVIAQKNELSHSKNRNLKGKEGEWVGENLYYFYASPVCEYKCGNMSKSWYDEIKDYNFDTGKSKNGGVVGHFTQLVWKATKEVGFGIGFNGNSIYAVANYYPGGNFNNAELENVGKLKK